MSKTECQFKKIFFCRLNGSILYFIIFSFFSLGHILKANDDITNDWPMFRHDAQRSGFSNNKLPDKLKLIWTRTFPALEPIWQDEVSLQFDSNNHSIVIGKKIFIASPKND